MIKPTGLKIGNLATYKGEIVIVTCINIDYYVCYNIKNQNVIDYMKFIHYLNVSDKDLQPIELTEEWLMKFGLEQSTVFGFNIRYRRGYFELWYYKGANEYICENVKMIKCVIKYVHQLQNLYFALTNTELILKP